MIGRVMVRVSDIDFDLQDSQFDVLGTAYMILIGLFASDAGKKGGEFFTPAGPSKLCATLAALGLDEAKTVGDCTCGSASMLLEVQKHLTTGKVGHLPLLFMTAEWNTTKDGKYIQNRNQILRRAISRFDDFEYQGYITGTYGCFQFTFSGMKKLEDLVIMKPDINQNIEQVIEEIRKENEKSSARYEELISVLQDIKNTPKNYGEYISDLANIAIIGSIIPSAVPKVGKLLGRLISVL